MDKVKEQEDALQFEDTSNEVPPKEVFTFNELRSCADLVRMHKSGVLEIKPVYQRDVVWSAKDRARFVDSLLKRLPIPSVCFSQDSRTNKMQVIDGLQRIDTIRAFLTEDDMELPDTEDIDPRLAGKTVADIRKNTPEVISDIENFALPVTLLRCDYSKPDHVEYIFTIFRRLNTGGIKLTNQEIRNAIFSGEFNRFLFECNENSRWVELLKRTTGQKNKNDRFKSIELLLKFFAFYDRSTKFTPSLARFLNVYMKDKRAAKSDEIDSKRELFKRTTNLLTSELFPKKLNSKMNSATLEAVLFGVARNIDMLEKLSKQGKREKIKSRYAILLKQESLTATSLGEGIYKRQKVLDRLTDAESSFSGARRA